MYCVTACKTDWGADMQATNTSGKTSSTDRARHYSLCGALAICLSFASEPLYSADNITPSKQQAFSEAIETARVHYANASNDFKKGKVRRKRAKAFCQLFRKTGFRVRNWKGTVLTLSATGGGYGILRVKIGPDTELSTGNVEAFDFDKTLIAPDTPVYDQLDALEDGMEIVFSGRFSRSKDDCVQEMRLTQKGGITHPLLLFKFTDLKPAE